MDVARPWQLHSVRRTGGEFGGGTWQYFSRGMERRRQPPEGRAAAATVVAPACPFAQLWEAAIARGAPPDAVALIEYDAEGYAFAIPDARVRLRFDAQCRLRP